MNCESGENKIRSMLSSLEDPDPPTMTSVRWTSNDAASRRTNRHLDSSTAKIFPFGDHWHKFELPKAKCVSKFIFWKFCQFLRCFEFLFMHVTSSSHLMTFFKKYIFVMFLKFNVKFWVKVSIKIVFREYNLYSFANMFEKNLFKN